MNICSINGSMQVQRFPIQGEFRCKYKLLTISLVNLGRVYLIQYGFAGEIIASSVTLSEELTLKFAEQVSERVTFGGGQ